MKARILIIWILLIQSFFLFAQISKEMEKINPDSLRSVLPELTGAEKIDAMNKIAFKFSQCTKDL